MDQIPDDPLKLYEDSYYDAREGSQSGYERYHYTAEHGLAWAASLIGLLRPSGRLLDVGCADGYLLKKLKHSHGGFGIEVNPHMAALSKSEGFPILATDLADPGLIERHADTFDIVSAIAVFEHIRDFRNAVENAIRLLKPDGILLFEVPVISCLHDSSHWLRSSLEHIHYPSEQSLHRLFETVLGFPLIGCEVDIRDFAPTFVGIVPKCREHGDSLRSLFAQLMQSPATAIKSPEQRRFRWLFELVHTAQISPDVLELLRSEDIASFEPALRERLLDLWIAQTSRLEELSRHLTEVEKARDWHAGRAQAFAGEVRELNEAQERQESLVQELSRYLKEVEGARDFHARQAEAFDHEAAYQREQVNKSLLVNRQQASEVESLHEQLNEMQESWSWRLTRPLRNMPGTLRPARKGAK